MAGTPSAQFGACEVACQDDTCAQNCFNTQCQGKEQQCDADEQKCGQQCPMAPPTDAQFQCIDACAAKTIAAAYDTCAAKCQDEQCDNTCFTQNCAGKEQQCNQAMDQCNAQCIK